MSEDLLRKSSRDKLAKLEVQNLRRRLINTIRSSNGKVLRNSQELISFSCNDYLGLTHQPVKMLPMNMEQGQADPTSQWK